VVVEAGGEVGGEEVEDHLEEVFHQEEEVEEVDVVAVSLQVAAEDVEVDEVLEAEDVADNKKTHEIIRNKGVYESQIQLYYQEYMYIYAWCIYKTIFLTFTFHAMFK